MRRLVSAVLALATLAPALVAPLAAQAPAPLRIDALMSERDRQETGVTRLTVAERHAFERWLARYTAAAVAGATRAVEESATPARSVPERTPDRKPAPARRAQRVALGATVEIVSVLENGGFLVMEDGTMWEVFVSDITRSTTWTAGDQVLVLDNPAPPDRLYRLRFENGRARSTASVRYAGKTGPGAKASSDSARTGGLPQETIFRSGVASTALYAPFVSPLQRRHTHQRERLDRLPGALDARAVHALDLGRALGPGRVGGDRRTVAVPTRNVAAPRR